MMNVHNMMEEVVAQRVNSLYEQIKNAKAKWLSCDCENCRLDAISYVLNRVPAKYIVSGRGVTHAASSGIDSQLKADIDAVGLEGIRIVSETKRPFHTQPRKACQVTKESDSPLFNFPTFAGTVLDGSTFEPLSGATVVLKLDDKNAEMVDKTWTNPSKTYQTTNGTYTFWPKSVTATSVGETKNFHFTVEVSADGYTPSAYSFDIAVTSKNEIIDELDSTISIKIRNIVLFKEDIKNDME